MNEIFEIISGFRIVKVHKKLELSKISAVIYFDKQRQDTIRILQEFKSEPWMAKGQNDCRMSSFEPKNERKYFFISALAS